MSFQQIPRAIDGPIGATHEYFSSLPSTNDYLLNDDRKASGHLVITDLQTSGRGRRGNSWQASAGENLLFSFSLSVTLENPLVSLMPIFTALSLCEAIDPFGSLSIGAKWPNDIVSDGRKLCGILIESRVQGDRVRVVVGIGLNVNQTRFPEELSAGATSLAAIAGRVLEREPLLGRIVDSLNAHLDGFTPATMVTDYSARCITLGKLIRYETNGSIREGRALRIDGRGRLIIDEAGTEYTYTGSEVTHLRPLS